MLKVTDDAKVTLLNCRVSGGGGGVYVANRAALVMKDCEIVNCGSSGLLICSSGKCRFECCTISNNQYVGVAVGGPHVTADSCVFDEVHISDNTNYGIKLYGGARARWIGPAGNIHGNGLAAVRCKEGSVLEGFGQ